MTPNNIVNMADMNGLDIIAVTDHNATGQLPVIEDIIDKSYDMLLIPGVEVTLKDDSHVLCYFKTVKDAYAFGEWLALHLPKGTVGDAGYVMDAFDRIHRHMGLNLKGPTDLSLTDLKKSLSSYDHVLAAAHVDRPKNNALKLHPPDAFDCFEHTRTDSDDVRVRLHDSDAHQLTQIHMASERHAMVLDECSVDGVFRRLRHG
jgi:hypothetical protein